MSDDAISLYYIHDPMCSWCWAFRPVWTALQQQLPESVDVKYLLGGLAPDSDVVMPVSLQENIQRHWQTIQKRVPGTMFDFDFWHQCTPRRSTYPACRAVIATKFQDPNREDAMIHAIQKAYYLEARNPSDDGVLMDLAQQLALNVGQFHLDLNAGQTQALLLQDIRAGQALGACGFPSLVLQKGDRVHSIAVDYNRLEPMQAAIEDLY
ncbi:DsbA family protein [Mariprofundus sp. EBB-1]|uniref:DsbA family protein n=1 Tax=Mariprofundus sp. EBB-1 TaxID=2650971 RepID=UPI000EF1E14D|nr:DsbA family protein [Mariprofundus sp. EBB-1]RLL56026.1 DsbA family protein [Mariprofundus sp. EBB-1]